MNRWLKRITVYLIGLFLVSFGVAVSVKSGLGVTSVNCIPYTLSLIFSTDMGYFTAGLYILFVLLQALILRRHFEKRYLLEIPCSVLFGGLVNLSNFLLADLAVPSLYLVRLLLLALSIVLVALGVYLYCSVDLIPLPSDGMILAISQKSGMRFHTVKIIFDSALVVIAATVSLVFLQGFVSVREGTIISSLFIGCVVGVLTRLFDGRVR